MLCLILQNTISTSETSIQNKNTKCSGSKQEEAKAKQANMKEMAHRKEDNHDMTIITSTTSTTATTLETATSTQIDNKSINDRDNSDSNNSS